MDVYYVVVDLAGRSDVRMYMRSKRERTIRTPQDLS
jgi:hypothetical protein